MKLTPTYHIMRNVYKPKRKLLTEEQIIDFIYGVVFRETGITEFRIKSKTRKQDVINAKRIVIYLVYNYTSLTLLKIAETVGLSDHSSICHHLQEIHNLCMYDKTYKLITDNCEDAIALYKPKLKRYKKS